jgi:zinc D-Ala-D-Ala dipeptidase
MAGGAGELTIARRAVVGGLLLAPVAACSDSTSPSPPAERVPARAKAPAGLVELAALDPTLKLDLRYATANNFTGRVLYSQARAFMQGVAAQALIRAHARAQAEGFGFTIYDAYRPWRVTKALWDATEPAKRDYVANPAKGSRHNRGCAVDMTLHRLSDGAQVEMPSAFDDFSDRAHRAYADDTPAARRHAELLERVMTAEGFIGMSNEWWHFDYRDWQQFPVLDLPFEKL